jgi:hypothetical protein
MDRSHPTAIPRKHLKPRGMYDRLQMPECSGEGVLSIITAADRKSFFDAMIA